MCMASRYHVMTLRNNIIGAVKQVSENQLGHIFGYAASNFAVLHLFWVTSCDPVRDMWHDVETIKIYSVTFTRGPGCEDHVTFLVTYPLSSCRLARTSILFCHPQSTFPAWKSLPGIPSPRIPARESRGQGFKAINTYCVTFMTDSVCESHVTFYLTYRISCYR